MNKPIFMVRSPLKATYLMIYIYRKPTGMLEIKQNYPISIFGEKRGAFHALIGKN